MKPTWGLVAALAMVTASLYGLNFAARLFYSGLNTTPRFTDAQVQQELQTWRPIKADVQASR